jgi:hypothetical protein
METTTAFSSFPKRRAPLPPEFAAIYSKYYKENRSGKSKASGLAQIMESWMHKKVAQDVRPGTRKATLEIGAGTLNHLPYERESTPYDIVEPFEFLFEASPNLNRVRTIYRDIAEISRSARYKRIISIATFEHICNLPEVIAQSALLLSDGGQLRAAIPSEGTILWRLGWKLTTGLEFRLKHHLDYEVLMKYEHVNTAREIEDMLRYFFARVEARTFGLARSLSFYQFFACSQPLLRKCLYSLERMKDEG